MHIHADAKGKVALDDTTLWANRCMKCHGNTISRFRLIAHYVSRVNFSQEIIFCNTRCIPAWFLIRRDQPWPYNTDPLNPKSTDFDIVSKTTTVPSFKSFRSVVFVLSCQHTHPHAYIHAYIVTKWSQYRRRGTWVQITGISFKDRLNTEI